MGGSFLILIVCFSLLFEGYVFLSLIVLEIIPLLLVLYCSKKKLILRKNNKELTILEYNYLFCSKQYYISLENIDAHVKFTKLYKYGDNCSLSKLFIYGIDSTKINFDTKNIKRVPHNFFILFIIVLLIIIL